MNARNPASRRMGDAPEVLIVGAGPAGLAAAAALASQGIGDILVIDRDDCPGGLPRFCRHPGFGLGYTRRPHSGPGFVARLLRDLPAGAVTIECGTTLLALRDGPVAEIVGPRLGLRRLRPRALIIATGIREASRGNLIVPGGRAEIGVMTTGQLQQLAARRVALPGRLKSLVVVGTEHVGFSAILAARDMGLAVRAILGEEDRVMSYPLLAWCARACGIEVTTGVTIRSIETVRGRVRAVKVRDGRGERDIPCDAVVFSSNWVPETAAFVGGPVEIDGRTRGPVVDQALRTTCVGVFAAGNVLHAVESSGWCATEGARAGLAAGRYLRGEIGGKQGTLHFTLSEEIDFMVPQSWDTALPPFDRMPVTLRVARDLRSRRLVVRRSNEDVALNQQRTFRRRRRTTIDPAAFDGLGDKGPMHIAIVPD